MAHNDKFGDTSCMGVTGKDGKVVWIFKWEDLREVVPDDVYKCIEALVQSTLDETCEECESCGGSGKRKKRAGDDYEKIADGYRGMLVDTMYELKSIRDGVEASRRINKIELLKQLTNVYENLDKNL